MAQHIELNPVSYLTIGTVGAPGNRVFYLQGSKGPDIVTLIIEKQQASMLSSSLMSLLEELSKSHPDVENREITWTDMRIREPLNPLFRVGNMGLGFNEEKGLLVIVAYELVEEDEEPSMVSFWTTRAQAQSLIQHAEDVVRAGRLICGNCRQPIDPEGHFCPNRNGHSK